MFGRKCIDKVIKSVLLIMTILAGPHLHVEIWAIHFNKTNHNHFDLFHSEEDYKVSILRVQTSTNEKEKLSSNYDKHRTTL